MLCGVRARLAASTALPASPPTPASEPTHIPLPPPPAPRPALQVTIQKTMRGIPTKPDRSVANAYGCGSVIQYK